MEELQEIVSYAEPQVQGGLGLTSAEAGDKLPLEIRGMPLPQPAGSGSWLRRYHKFGSLTDSEYSRLAISYRQTYSDLTRTYVAEMLEAGDFYRWSQSEVYETDEEVRELLGGEAPRLLVGGAKEPFGESIVVFDEARHPDVDDYYWDFLWLDSAAEGRPAARPRVGSSLAPTLARLAILPHPRS